MPNRLKLASAGAGKTTELVQESLAASDAGRRVLILTYTRNNQFEVVKNIQRERGFLPSNIRVKGWFSFLLEDLIRPYQTCFFPERIQNILFNPSDPHIRGGRTIWGRAEMIGPSVNSKHYLHSNMAHTCYLAKLAAKICKEKSTGRGRAARSLVIQRLSAIYDLILIDEVQDLVGWDYEVLSHIVRHQEPELRCAGDFRQTIYETAHARKAPTTSTEKRAWFQANGFTTGNLNHSWRCIDLICQFADLVHAGQGYPATISNVTEIPAEVFAHRGIFTVSSQNVAAYLERFKPVILRRNRSTLTDLCKGRQTLNFGESKGLGYDRVLILPTEPQRAFLSGDKAPLLAGRSEKSINQLYVAITRARYSVAFLTDIPSTLAEVSVWQP